MVLESLDILTPWAEKAKHAQLEPFKQEYLAKYGPYAKRYGKIMNIDPGILLAWGASESNYGKAGSIFGIKGKSSSGKSKTYDTWEMIDGQRVDIKDEFAVYDSPDEAFQDMIALLQTPRYKAAYDYVQSTGDGAGFMRMMNDAGYATDRNWADSVVALARGLSGGD